MLHEKDFKIIIGVYKQLRQEGVIFPLREAKNQFFIDFQGEKSPIFESIEGQKIYEEPSKVIAREKITISDIKVDANMTKQEEPIDYQHIYNDQQQNENNDIVVNKEQIENIEEIIESIMQNPQEFIVQDQELSQQILKNLENIIKQIKSKFESGDDDSEYFKNKFFDLKKKQRIFEEQIDMIKYNKNTKQQNQENEQIDLLDLDIGNDDISQNNNTIQEQQNQQKNDIKIEQQNNQIDFLGFAEQKEEQKENQNTQITFEQKQKKVKIVESDPFDFIEDKFVQLISNYQKIFKDNY